MQKIKMSIVVISTALAFLFIEHAFFQIIHKPIKYLAVGNLDYPIRQKDAVPDGGLSIIDFDKSVDADIQINSLKILSNDDKNEVRLKIWRLMDNGNYKVIAQTNAFSLTLGTNVLYLKDFIIAKKGDILGLYMKNSEIARSSKNLGKGRIYSIGDQDKIQKNTTLKDHYSGYLFVVYGMSPD